MTARPLAITLFLQNRLSELLEETRTLNPYKNAACADANTDLFFSDEPTEILKALAICQTCPIRAKCLEDALSREDYGVWGGTTEAQRDQMIAANKSLVLPKADVVGNELRKIMTGDVAAVASSYQVELRTVHRWRTAIRSNSEAMKLAGVNK